MDLSRLGAGQTSVKQTVRKVIDLVSDGEEEKNPLKPRALSDAPVAKHEEVEYESGTDSSGEVWETESLFEDALEEIGDDRLLEGGMLHHKHNFSYVNNATNAVLQARMSALSKRRENIGACCVRKVPRFSVKLLSRPASSPRRNLSRLSASARRRFSKVPPILPIMVSYPWP
jgi:hypothetical protein